MDTHPGLVMSRKNAADGVKQIRKAYSVYLQGRPGLLQKGKETELSSSKTKDRKVFKCGNELLENVRHKAGQYDN